MKTEILQKKCLLPSGPCKTEYFILCKKSDKCENKEIEDVNKK
jgi:hypothetical protein